MLNNNKERKAWWDYMQEHYSQAEIEQAISTLKPFTQTVIRLHYGQNVPLKDIAPIIGRTLTIVRNHQCLGIHQLYRHFNKR